VCGGCAWVHARVRGAAAGRGRAGPAADLRREGAVLEGPALPRRDLVCALLRADARLVEEAVADGPAARPLAVEGVDLRAEGAVLHLLLVLPAPRGEQRERWEGRGRMAGVEGRGGSRRELRTSCVAGSRRGTRGRRRIPLLPPGGEAAAPEPRLEIAQVGAAALTRTRRAACPISTG
jgi:hypothetical protein